MVNRDGQSPLYVTLLILAASFELTCEDVFLDQDRVVVKTYS